MESTSTTTSTKSTDFAVDIGIWGASQRSSPEEQGQGAWNIQPRTTSPAFHRFPDPILHFSRSRLPAGGHPSPLPLGRPLPTPSPTAGTVCNARLGRWSLGPKEPMLSSVPSLGLVFSPEGFFLFSRPIPPPSPSPSPDQRNTHIPPLDPPMHDSWPWMYCVCISRGQRLSSSPPLSRQRAKRDGLGYRGDVDSRFNSRPDTIPCGVPLKLQTSGPREQGHPATTAHAHHEDSMPATRPPGRRH